MLVLRRVLEKAGVDLCLVSLLSLLSALSWLRFLRIQRRAALVMAFNTFYLLRRRAMSGCAETRALYNDFTYGTGNVLCDGSQNRLTCCCY